MSSYTVYVSPQAYRDIDEIYEYIRTELFAEDAAIRIILLCTELILMQKR